MGVHTAPVENLKHHSVTNRVIYPHDLIHVTSLVQDTPCGGQVVLSSDTLSALTGTGSSTYGAIIHLGAHLLEDNVAAHQKMSMGSVLGSGESFRLDMKVSPPSSSGMAVPVAVRIMLRCLPSKQREDDIGILPILSLC
jgi:hypothetical protein